MRTAAPFRKPSSRKRRLGRRRAREAGAKSYAFSTTVMGHGRVIMMCETGPKLWPWRACGPAAIWHRPGQYTNLAP